MFKGSVHKLRNLGMEEGALAKNAALGIGSGSELRREKQSAPRGAEMAN